MYLSGEPKKPLLIWGTKIVITGPDDILIAFHEKHKLILNKKLQIVNKIKKREGVKSSKDKAELGRGK